MPKETPPLALAPARPARVVALGALHPSHAASAAPHEVGRRMREALHRPCPDAVAGLAAGKPWRDRWETRCPRGYVSLDFGKPVHGCLRLEIADAPAGTVLEFGYGELATNPRDGSPLLRADGSFDPEFTVGAPFGDHVVLRAEAQTIELPDERTWRWLLIHWGTPADGPLVVSALSCLTSQHPVTLRGSFDAGDPQLDALTSLCLDHARITMSDTYVDTPGREDAQWLEDIQYRARLAATWFGDTALRQVTLRHAVEQQDPRTGLFRVFAPEDHATAGCQFLDWGMTWIGLLHDDWQWTGETDRARRYFLALVRFLDALHRLTNANGLLTGENCLADLRTSERADYAAGGVESIPNAWYHGHLRQAAELAAAIGETSHAHTWTERADLIRENFTCFLTDLPDGSPTVAETWSPARGPSGFGQAAVVSAIFHDVVAAESAPALLAAAFTEPAGDPPAGMKRWNTPTTIYRVLRCLCEHGLGEIARAHLLAVYEPFLPDGPLPEYFLPGEGQPADPTGSHGWAAVPAAWLHDTVLGVRWARDEGRPRLIVEPRHTGWDRVAGKVATPFGLVEVAIDWTTGELTATGPPGVPITKRLTPIKDATASTSFPP